jgi:DNA-binding LytR/AlgR family response regulator
MPNGLDGVELARRVQRFRPGLKVILTTGYAGATVARNGAEDEFPVLAKPYRPAELARRIAATLRDEAPRTGA